MKSSSASAGSVVLGGEIEMHAVEVCIGFVATCEQGDVGTPVCGVDTTLALIQEDDRHWRSGLPGVHTRATGGAASRDKAILHRISWISAVAAESTELSNNRAKGSGVSLRTPVEKDCPGIAPAAVLFSRVCQRRKEATAAVFTNSFLCGNMPRLMMVPPLGIVVAAELSLLRARPVRVRIAAGDRRNMSNVQTDDNAAAPAQRYTRRLSDKIMLAFHDACDQGDFEVAERLLQVLEMMLIRRSLPAAGNRRRNLDTLVAAHEPAPGNRAPVTKS